jgi:hypothetical protein
LYRYATKAKARKTRDSMVGNITNVKAKKKTTLLADAAIEVGGGLCASRIQL